MRVSKFISLLIVALFMSNLVRPALYAVGGSGGTPAGTTITNPQNPTYLGSTPNPKVNEMVTVAPPVVKVTPEATTTENIVDFSKMTNCELSTLMGNDKALEQDKFKAAQALYKNTNAPANKKTAALTVLLDLVVKAKSAAVRSLASAELSSIAAKADVETLLTIGKSTNLWVQYAAQRGIIQSNSATAEQKQIAVDAIMGFAKMEKSVSLSFSAITYLHGIASNSKTDKAVLKKLASLGSASPNLMVLAQNSLGQKVDTTAFEKAKEYKASLANYGKKVSEASKSLKTMVDGILKQTTTITGGQLEKLTTEIKSTQAKVKAILADWKPNF